MKGNRKQTDGDKFLMTTEVAKLLNRSQSAVIKYEKAGRLRAIRAGNGFRLFLESDVRKLAAELEGL